MNTYLILTNNSESYIREAEDVNTAIYNYFVDAVGKTSIFLKMCNHKDIFAIEELISYVNANVYSNCDAITKIYALGEQIYGK